MHGSHSIFLFACVDCDLLFIGNLYELFLRVFQFLDLAIVILLVDIDLGIIVLLGVGRSKWSIDLREDKANHEQKGSKDERQNSHDLIGLRGVPAVVSKIWVAIGIVRDGGADEKHNKQVGDNALDKVSPEIRNVLDGRLDQGLELEDVAERHFPPNLTPSPLAWAFLHFLGEKVSRDGHSQQGVYDEGYKPSHRSIIPIESEPESTGNDDCQGKGRKGSERGCMYRSHSIHTRSLG